MKKILFRAGMLPHQYYPVNAFMEKNLIGGNIGNLLYTNGIIRNIVTNNEYELISNNYKYAKLDPNIINETYSAFIIPLADAFRENFMVELDKITNLVKKLKIPCYVIGVGLRDEYEPTFKNGFKFDENVKRFVSAVLEKSSSIGVRGQITADYLSQLGFKEGRDHVIIGCPSMYTFGPNLHVNKPNITSNSHISINTSSNAPKVVKNLLERTVKDIHNCTFVPQVIKEFKYLYIGDTSEYKGKALPFYLNSKLFKDEKNMFFVNVQSWLDFFKDVDLSVGSRLHGNVAALLSNTPSIFLPKDARERELNDVHHFNSFPVKDLNDKTTIWELIEKSNFNIFEKYQQENYKNFLNFLDMNNIEHIDQSKDKLVPYDKYLVNTQIEPPVQSFKAISKKEYKDRQYKLYGKAFKDTKRDKIEDLLKKLYTRYMKL